MKALYTKILQYHHLFILCFALLSLYILILRLPSALTNPQFWAEDGKRWFATAYNQGPFIPLFQSMDGYLQTLSRLTADLSLLFPITFAPLVFNSVAIFIQFLPIIFLLSSRMKNVMPNILTRVFFIGLYLLMPNTAEIYFNITNSQ